MFNKKGEEDLSENHLNMYLLIGEILVVLILFAIIGTVLINNYPEDTNTLVAKDLGLVIQTVSASPYRINYDYPRNTEGMSITIDDKEVSVNSGEKEGKYAFLLTPGFEVKPATIERNLIVSLFSSGRMITFDAVDDSIYCVDLPIFKKANPSVKLTIKSTSAEEKTFLDKVVVLVSSHNVPRKDHFTIVENNADINVNLGFDSEMKLSVKYDESVEGYERLSCFVLNYFSNDDMFKSVSSTKSKGDVFIKLGSYSEIKKMENNEDVNKLAQKYSLGIYESLKRGFSNG